MKTKTNFTLFESIESSDVESDKFYQRYRY